MGITIYVVTTTPYFDLFNRNDKRLEGNILQD